MATQFTASIANGYATGPTRGIIGPYKVFVAHFSSPISGTSTSTAYIDLMGFNTIRFASVQNGVESSFAYTTNSAGQQLFQWCFTTDAATGLTGNIFVLGH
jgi:hypothetical protein